jgi:hypothetical protein
MSRIEQTGTYRGSIVDHGISASKNGAADFSAALLAMEKYNFDTREWEDYSKYDDNEIVSHNYIYGKKGETFVCEKVRKITDWDGADLQELANMDLSACGIQFRVIEDTYEDVTSLKVDGINEYDAIPGSGSGVVKGTPDEIKALNAKFKKYMKPKQVTPATAKPVDIPATPKKQSTKKGTVKVVETPVPVAPPDAPTAPLPKSAIPEGKCSRTEAYDDAYAMKVDSIADDAFNKEWFNAIESVTGSTSQDNIEPEQWFHIKNKLIEETGIPF